MLPSSKDCCAGQGYSERKNRQKRHDFIMAKFAAVGKADPSIKTVKILCRCALLHRSSSPASDLRGGATPLARFAECGGLRPEEAHQNVEFGVRQIEGVRQAERGQGNARVDPVALPFCS